MGRCKFVFISLFFLIVLSGSATTNRDVGDVEFLDGLRDRRLFSLAVDFCKERLANSALSDRQRIRMAIELSRTYASQAIHGQPSVRSQLWQKARNAIDVLRSDYAHDSQFLLADVQHALVTLAEGELTRQEIELGHAGEQGYQSARSAIRQAIQELEAVKIEIDLLLRGTRIDDEFSKSDLIDLNHNIQFQLARALRNQGISYPSGSADRIHALTQAIQRLEPLVQLTNDQPLAWSSRIDHVTCHRLLENTRIASQSIEALLRDAPPVAIQIRAQAERIRVALQEDGVEQALAFIQELPTAVIGRNVELDLSILETFVAAWQSVEVNSKETKLWENRIAVRLNKLEDNHGLYWKRRGAMLLTSTADTGNSTGNIDLLVQTAQNFYTRGQWQEAIVAFDRAAAQARQLEDTDRSFRLSYTSAKVEQEYGQRSAAIQRFRMLANDHRDHLQSGDAHLLAISIMARQMREKPSSMSEDYVNLLYEHLEHWNHAHSADTARWWLGKLHEHRREWRDAVNVYREISMDFDRHAEAIHATSRCWKKLCESLLPNSSLLSAEANNAVSAFEQIVLGTDDRLPERWSRAMCDALLEAVRFRLWFLDRGFDRAESMLVAALQSSDGVSASWSSSAQVLLVALRARRGKMSEAQESLRRIVDYDPIELIGLLETISRLTRIAKEDDQTARADLLLSTVKLLSRRQDELTPLQRVFMRRIEAEALINTGERLKALEILQALSVANPRDGTIHEAYAQLLLDGNNRDSLLRAIDQWRMVGRQSRTGSGRWYRSKYSLAVAHYRLGNRHRAAEIIRIVQAVPPGLAGTPLQARLERLLKQCEEKDIE